MGILLIGVVAALFFRNEPLPIAEQLSHPRRQQLNQRLRDRDVAVYIPDEPVSTSSTEPGEDLTQWSLRSVVEGFDQQNRQAPAPVEFSDGRRSDHENQNRQSLDGYRTWRPGRQAQSAKPEPVSKAERSTSEQTNDSMPVAAASDLQKLLRAPAENGVPRRPLPPLHASPPEIAALRSPTPPARNTAESDWDDDETVLSSARPGDAAASPGVADFDEHTVQFGETLSSIAEHYLGSQSHYRRIFEANRDRMSSPDRLKVGMRLRIPRTAASER